MENEEIITESVTPEHVEEVEKPEADKPESGAPENSEADLDYKALYELEKEKSEKWKTRFKKTVVKVGKQDEDEVDALVQQKLQQKEISTKVQVIRDQLPEELQGKFDAEYAELTEGRELTSESVDKYLKSVLTIITPADDEEINRVKATAVSIGLPSKVGSSKNLKDDSLKEQSAKFLKEQGVL